VEKSSVAEDPHPALPRTRLLLVEDEPLLRSTLERTLVFLGYEVESVEGGVAAQAALACGRFDLLLTDVSLGDAVDGFQLAVWARDRLPGLPVVLISGLALSTPPQALLDDAAVWMLPKPFSVVALKAILRRALAATRGDSV
jgi:two-component system response regulator MprA